MGNLPWTPEGKHLLTLIKGIIDANGGIEAYTDIINQEVNLSQYQRDKRQMEQQFKVVVKYKMTHQDAADLLGMNRSTFIKKFYEFLNDNSASI